MNEDKKFEEQIRNANQIITELISNKDIRTSIDDTDKIRLVTFYKKQAKLSLTAAEIFLNISLLKRNSKRFIQ
ncbi:hypothetical protein HY636_01670 [Candidatus Woesearchaeota archaeon]|nr:hypothetical protein [Candidatus Woesearchaeota archaeon]